MSFLTTVESKISNKFEKNGYLISKAESKKSLSYIYENILRYLNKIIRGKKISDLNKIHKFIDKKNVNEFRLEILNYMAKDKNFRYHYFNLARNSLYALVGNELVMQKAINLSIQLPMDNSSLLPIHSDVWSGDSEFEINIWLPLVNCYDSKSMYILEQKNYEYFLKGMKKKVSDSEKIFQKIKNKLKWIDIKYGNFLIFNQCLPHGNVVNTTNETRWSMNCRFKNLFSPYGDKKIGEFFRPITTRVMTKIAINYKSPF